MDLYEVQEMAGKGKAIKRFHNSPPPNRRREFIMTMSPTGQLTLPSTFRKEAEAHGIRRFAIREIDPEAGVYQLERLPGLAAQLATVSHHYSGKALRKMLDDLRSEEQ